MNKYQAVIIGFGKAGKTLAVTLAKAGWRVALIEQSNAMYGGTCINIGCIPTKTLVHDAQQHTDFVRAIQRKNEVVNFLRNKNFHNLADMPNIDVIDGQAEFINNHSLRVHRPEGNLEIHGEKIFINTGAQTVVPPIPGITTTPGVYVNIAYRKREADKVLATRLALRTHRISYITLIAVILFFAFSFTFSISHEEAVSVCKKSDFPNFCLPPQFICRINAFNHFAVLKHPAP